MLPFPSDSVKLRLQIFLEKTLLLAKKLGVSNKNAKTDFFVVVVMSSQIGKIINLGLPTNLLFAPFFALNFILSWIFYSSLAAKSVKQILIFD